MLHYLQKQKLKNRSSWPDITIEIMSGKDSSTFNEVLCSKEIRGLEYALFPKGPITNYHKPRGLRQQKLTLVLFWKLEVWTQVWLLLEALRKNPPWFSLGLRGSQQITRHFPLCLHFLLYRWIRGARCPSNLVWAHFNLITSEKKLFPNKVTFTSIGG